MERQLRRASQAFAENSAALQAEARALREQMPSHPSLGSLRDHDICRTERVNSTIPQVRVPSNMIYLHVARINRDMIVRDPPLPLFQGYSEGGRSELKGPVLFYNHIERCFAYADAGSYRLPADQPTEGGEWVTRMDHVSGWQCDLPIETTATNLGTHSLSFPPTTVTVSRVTGGRDLVSPGEVTATDLLRSLVGEAATHPQAPPATQNAHNEGTTKRNEAIAAVDTWLTDAFRASVVNRDRPHTTEMLFSWSYISEDDITELTQRLSNIHTPEANQRVGGKSIVNSMSTRWSRH